MHAHLRAPGRRAPLCWPLLQVFSTVCTPEASSLHAGACSQHVHTRPRFRCGIRPLERSWQDLRWVRTMCPFSPQSDVILEHGRDPVHPLPAMTPHPTKLSGQLALQAILATCRHSAAKASSTSPCCSQLQPLLRSVRAPCRLYPAKWRSSSHNQVQRCCLKCIVHGHQACVHRVT